MSPSYFRRMAIASGALAVLGIGIAIGYSLRSARGIPPLTEDRDLSPRLAPSAERNARRATPPPRSPAIEQELPPPPIDWSGFRAASSCAGASGILYALAFTGDDRFLLAAGAAGRIWIWDAQTGALARACRAPGASVPVYALAAVPGTRMVLSGGADGLLRLWDAERGELEKTFAKPKPDAGPIRALCMLPDGLRFVSAGGVEYARPERSAVLLWDLEADGPLRAFTGLRGVACCADVSPDGKRLAAGDSEGEVTIWDLEKGTLAASFQVEAQGAKDVYGVAFDAAGERLATAGAAGIRVWSLDDTRPLAQLRNYRDAQRRLQHGHTARAVRFTPDGRALAAAMHGTLVLWKAGDLTQWAALDAGESDLHDFAFAREGLWIATPGDGGQVTLHEGERESAGETGVREDF